MIEDFRLRIFDTVVKCGNFTKAAKQLKISQPAVSQNISELERAVGSQLLERSRGDISLTDEGRLFHSYVSKILYWYGRINGELVEKTVQTPQAKEIELEGGRTASVYADGANLIINIE